jgi:hypothetical protein
MCVAPAGLTIGMHGMHLVNVTIIVSNMNDASKKEPRRVLLIKPKQKVKILQVVKDPKGGKQQRLAWVPKVDK